MKTFSPFVTAVFVGVLTAFAVSGCAPRRVTVVEPAPPVHVVVRPPVRTVVVRRPFYRPHPYPHRVVVIRRR